MTDLALLKMLSRKKRKPKKKRDKDQIPKLAALPDFRDPNVVFTLHLGPIRRVHRLVYESWIHMGYDVYLYSYDAPTAMFAIPYPAQVLDANTVVSEERLAMDPDGSWDSFSNYFRFVALAHHGGLWLDNDYVLMDVLPDQYEALAIEQCGSNPLPYVLQLPAQSLYARRGRELAEQLLRTPDAQAETLRRIPPELWGAVSHRLLPTAVYHPVPQNQFYFYIDGPELEVRQMRMALQEGRIKGVKLWHQYWDRRDISIDAASNDKSVYQFLWRRFFY